MTLTVSESSHISFELPKPKITALVDCMGHAGLLQAVNADAVLDSRPDFAALKEHDLEMKVTGATVFGFHENNDEQNT